MEIIKVINERAKKEREEKNKKRYIKKLKLKLNVYIIIFFISSILFSIYLIINKDLFNSIILIILFSILKHCLTNILKEYKTIKE